MPGKQNPADLASMESTVDELRQSDLWRNCPDFLCKDYDHWPNAITSRETPLDDHEIKQVFLGVRVVNESAVDRLLASSSSWYTTRCPVAWYSRSKCHPRTGASSQSRHALQEHDVAEKDIWSFLQGVSDGATINSLRIDCELLRTEP